MRNKLRENQGQEDIQVDCCYYLKSNWIRLDVPLWERNKAIEIYLQVRMPRLHKEKDGVLLLRLPL